MPEKHTVFVAIGSNQDREASILYAVDELRKSFSNIELSSVYESHSMGFPGDDFFNLVCRFSAEENLDQVYRALKSIEQSLPGNAHVVKHQPRKLDIDLLLYDDEIIETQVLKIPRQDIEDYAFVLGPLSEIAPDVLHPKKQHSFADMWQAMESLHNSIWKVDFTPQSCHAEIGKCH